MLPLFIVKIKRDFIFFIIGLHNIHSIGFITNWYLLWCFSIVWLSFAMMLPAKFSSIATYDTLRWFGAAVRSHTATIVCFSVFWTLVLVHFFTDDKWRSFCVHSQMEKYLYFLETFWWIFLSQQYLPNQSRPSYLIIKSHLRTVCKTSNI